MRSASRCTSWNFPSNCHNIFVILQPGTYKVIRLLKHDYWRSRRLAIVADEASPPPPTLSKGMSLPCKTNGFVITVVLQLQMLTYRSGFGWSSPAELCSSSLSSSCSSFSAACVAHRGITSGAAASLTTTRRQRSSTRRRIRTVTPTVGVETAAAVGRRFCTATRKTTWATSDTLPDSRWTTTTYRGLSNWLPVARKSSAVASQDLILVRAWTVLCGWSSRWVICSPRVSRSRGRVRRFFAESFGERALPKVSTVISSILFDTWFFFSLYAQHCIQLEVLKFLGRMTRRARYGHAMQLRLVFLDMPTASVAHSTGIQDCSCCDIDAVTPR